MQRLFSVKQLQSIDDEAAKLYDMPSLLLMNNAGQEVANFIIDNLLLTQRRKVAIYCGSGNNGGDGLACACYLLNQKVEVEIIIITRSKYESEPGIVFLNQLIKRNAHISVYSPDDEIPKHDRSEYIVVDAIYGIGIDPVRGVKLPIGSADVAIDVPSGLNPDNGFTSRSVDDSEATVYADYTVTFGGLKPGLFINKGSTFCGTILHKNIGFPLECYSQKDKAATFARLFEESDAHRVYRAIQPGKLANKHNQGHLMIFAGSPGLSGAAILASNGGLVSGCGLVKTVVPSTLYNDLLAQASPSILFEFFPGKFGYRPEFEEQMLSRLDWANSIVIGPGLSSNPYGLEFAEWVIAKSKVPVIVDADALRVINPTQKYEGNIIITPHLGEYRRIFASNGAFIPGYKVDTIQEQSLNTNLSIIAKGPGTMIAVPGQPPMINTSGNQTLAHGGTGDVLAGLIGGLVANYVVRNGNVRPNSNNFQQLLSFAVWVHGRAGELAEQDLTAMGFHAELLPKYITRVFRELRAEDQ